MSNFWALFWPQKGRGPTLCDKGPGTQNPNKKLVNDMELLGYILSQNHVSKNFRPEPPPLTYCSTHDLI